MPTELQPKHESLVDRAFSNPGQAIPIIGHKTHEAIARELFTSFERRHPELPGVAVRLHQWFQNAPGEYGFASGAIRITGECIVVSCERVTSKASTMRATGGRTGMRGRVANRGTSGSGIEDRTEEVTLQFTIRELFPDVLVAPTEEALSV